MSAGRTGSGWHDNPALSGEAPKLERQCMAPRSHGRCLAMMSLHEGVWSCEACANVVPMDEAVIGNCPGCGKQIACFTTVQGNLALMEMEGRDWEPHDCAATNPKPYAWWPQNIALHFASEARQGRVARRCSECNAYVVADPTDPRCTCGGNLVSIDPPPLAGKPGLDEAVNAVRGILAGYERVCGCGLIDDELDGLRDDRDRLDALEEATRNHSAPRFSVWGPDIKLDYFRGNEVSASSVRAAIDRISGRTIRRQHNGDQNDGN